MLRVAKRSPEEWDMLTALNQVRLQFLYKQTTLNFRSSVGTVPLHESQ